MLLTIFYTVIDIVLNLSLPLQRSILSIQLTDYIKSASFIRTRPFQYEFCFYKCANTCVFIGFTLSLILDLPFNIRYTSLFRSRDINGLYNMAYLYHCVIYYTYYLIFGSLKPYVLTTQVPPYRSS